MGCPPSAVQAVRPESRQGDESNPKEKRTAGLETRKEVTEILRSNSIALRARRFFPDPRRDRDGGMLLHLYFIEKERKIYSTDCNIEG